MSVQQSELTDLRLRVGAEHRLDELYVSKADDSILGLNFSDRKLLLGTLTSYQCYCFNEIAGIQSQRNGGDPDANQSWVTARRGGHWRCSIRWDRGFGG